MDGKRLTVKNKVLHPYHHTFQQYGVVEEGVVYPGDVEVIVELNNGLIICSDVTVADTSCTVTLPRDVYNISITQSNDIGSTVDSAGFDSECVL